MVCSKETNFLVSSLQYCKTYLLITHIDPSLLTKIFWKHSGSFFRGEHGFSPETTLLTNCPKISKFHLPVHCCVFNTNNLKY